MIYYWYRIFNVNDFLDTGLTSKKYTWDLVAIGLTTILVTKGELVSMLYDGVMLSLDMNDKNPFEFENRAAYQKPNGDVYLGISAEEFNAG